MIFILIFGNHPLKLLPFVRNVIQKVLHSPELHLAFVLYCTVNEEFKTFCSCAWPLEHFKNSRKALNHMDAKLLYCGGLIELFTIGNHIIILS